MVMLWNRYPKSLDDVTLEEAYKTLEGDPPEAIPMMVWLCENPDSPLPFPGKIDLFGHDCTHLLLKKGFTSAHEAYVVGFTMGNDQRTTSLHLLLFKAIAFLLYPPKYRLSHAELAVLDRGFKKGRSTEIKDLNQLYLESWNHKTLHELRMELNLEIEPSGDLSRSLN